VRARDITEEVSGHFLDIGNIEIFESIGGAPVVVATYIQRQKPGFAAGVDPFLRHIEVAFEHAAFFLRVCSTNRATRRENRAMRLERRS
jgi:hypothetical protein